MVTLSQKQLQRMKVVEKVVEGHLAVVQAAELLNLSERQVKRLKKRYDPNHAAWVYHGNRGKPPVNRIGDAARRQVVF
jgi:hypothetical protein